MLGFRTGEVPALDSPGLSTLRPVPSALPRMPQPPHAPAQRGSQASLPGGRARHRCLGPGRPPRRAEEFQGVLVSLAPRQRGVCLRSPQGDRGTPTRAHASPDMYPWARHVQTEAPGLQAQTLVPRQAARQSARICPKCPPAVPPPLVLGKGPGPARMACRSPGQCCAPADTTCPDPACKEHAGSCGFGRLYSPTVQPSVSVVWARAWAHTPRPGPEGVPHPPPPGTLLWGSRGSLSPA